MYYKYEDKMIARWGAKTNQRRKTDGRSVDLISTIKHKIYLGISCVAHYILSIFLKFWFPEILVQGWRKIKGVK